MASPLRRAWDAQFMSHSGDHFNGGTAALAAQWVSATGYSVLYGRCPDVPVPTRSTSFVFSIVQRQTDKNTHNRPGHHELSTFYANPNKYAMLLDFNAAVNCKYCKALGPCTEHLCAGLVALSAVMGG